MNTTLPAAQSAQGANGGGWADPVPLKSGLYRQSNKLDGTCTECNRGVQMTLHNGQQLYCVVCKKFTAHRRGSKTK